jgi:hypothetical protein
MGELYLYLYLGHIDTTFGCIAKNNELQMLGM